MKIFFPIGSFYPSQFGGPNNTIYWLSKALFEQGIQTTVLSGDMGLKGSTEVKFNQWIAADCGKVRYQKTTIHYLPFRFLIIAMKEIPQIDIMHLTAVFYPPSWILATWALLWGKKVVWSPRGEFDPQALVYSTWKKKPVIALVKKFLAHRVTFHTTSALESQYVKDILGNEIDIIELPNYIITPTKVEKKPEHYFLYIGRIHPKKAIENLINALFLSESFKQSDFILKIAGDYDNEYGRSLQQLVQKLHLEHKVSFLGMVEKEAKQILLAGAYFTFMPSHTENFGNVVVEALAQGTPVVASKGTPWEVLVIKKAGFWTENTPNQLSAIINEILVMPTEEYNQYRTNSLNLLHSEFDINKNIDKWITTYQTIQ